MPRSWSLIALVCILALTCGSVATAADAATEPYNTVVQWNRALLTIVRTPGAQPATVHTTRDFAIMHAAIYDAVNAIDATHEPYLVRIERASPHASQQAAAAAAAHEVLVELFPAFQTFLDAQLDESLASIADGADKTEGVDIGRAVAQSMVTLRSNDGAAAAPIPHVFGNAPGDYQSTPPNMPPQPQFTQWSHVIPFALERARQFRPGPPPPLTSAEYTIAFNEVKSIGVANSTVATADQVLIGRFWNGAIQNYWNEITQTAVLARHLNTAQSARAFALLNLSFADSVIAFYDAKYTYNFWRPVTAIRNAGKDENPRTMEDDKWLPASGNTAPDPSYPGAHAAISGAGAFVLNSIFGSRPFRIDVTSEVLPGAVRSFDGFPAIEGEASASRIFAGQHFRTDEDAGGRLGRSVADFVVDHFLRRVRDRDADRGDGPNE
jgi:hypothetical protein